MSKLRTEIVPITPFMAAEWMKLNIHNRPINRARVQKFANAMRNGEWVLNGDAVRFGLSGNLIDGQHRLEAVILSGVTIKSLVIWDLEDSVFTTIDSGGVRSLSDVLAITGEINTSSLASSLSLLHMYLEGCVVSSLSSWTKFTRGKQLSLLNEHQGLRESVQATTGKSTLRKLFPRSMSGFLHYTLGAGCKTNRDIFFAKLQEPVGLTGNNPIYLLRERLQDNRASKAKLPPYEIMALCFKTWNALLFDLPVKCLRWTTTGRTPEMFPMPKDRSGSVIFNAKQS